MEYFVLGIIASQILFPIADSLTSIVMTACEVVKAYLNTKITKYNIQMREMAEREEPKRTIGFEVSDDE